MLFDEFLFAVGLSEGATVAKAAAERAEVPRGVEVGCINEPPGVDGEDCASDAPGEVRGEGVQVPRGVVGSGVNDGRGEVGLLSDDGVIFTDEGCDNSLDPDVMVSRFGSKDDGGSMGIDGRAEEALLSD